VDILVHIMRTTSGKRIIDEIVKVGPLESNHFTVIPVFLYKEGDGLVQQKQSL